MCDEAKLKNWARDAINRRQFGALAGAAAMVACAPATGNGSGKGESGLTMFSDAVSIETQDGMLDGFLVYPEQGQQFPGVIMWPDIAGLRKSKMGMAMRLANEGYAVLVVNPYYRDVAGEQFADFAAFIGEDGFQKVGPWREKLDAAAIMRDAKSIVAWLDQQPQIDSSRGIGTQGYCMGGPFTIWSAAAAPDRITAAASFHGGGLVRDDNPMSPHKLLDQTQASFLIAVAQDDDAKTPEMKTVFASAAKAAGRPAEIDVYAGDHGWTVPDSPAYAEKAAERAFADLKELYSNAL